MLTKINQKILLLILLITISSSCFALHPRIETNGGDLIINGVTSCKFRNPDGNMSPADRARMAQIKLVELSGEYLTPESFSYTKATDNMYNITCRNVYLFSVYNEDAEILGSTAEGLCKVWIKNIREALVAEPIYMDNSKAIIPLNDSRTKQIKGAFSDVPTISIANTNIVSVTYNENTKSINIVGKELGKTNVVLSANGFSFELLVEVKEYAALIPDTVTFYVTGNPISSNLIKNSLKNVAERNTVTKSGASVNIGDISWSEKALYPGQKSNAKVKVSAQGSAYITISKEVIVSIENKNTSMDNPDTLLYSNHPETMEKFQDLFVGHLNIRESTRLLYHHLNATKQTGKLTIEIINPNSTPVTLRSMKASSKPMVDTIAIGLIATKSFMDIEDKNISTFDTIPPNSRVCYLSDTLKNNDSSSGIMQFTQMDGIERCIVRINLAPISATNIDNGEIQNYTGTGNFNFSDYIFLNPIKKIEETFTCGKNWVFISMGKQHLETEKGIKLYGNYGVTYDIDLLIENPLDTPQKVKINFDPTAGSAAAYFTINEKPVTIHHIKPPNEYSLANITLSPNEKRKIHIKSMPVSGSNYPAKIIVGLVN